MDDQPPQPIDPSQMSEDELRAAYEEQLRQIRVEDVLVQTVVSLLNLGGRRAGLAAGGPGPDGSEPPDERDPEQLRLAVEGVRALLPLVEPVLGADAAQLRDALAQLQMAYARGAGVAGTAPGAAPAESPATPPPDPSRPGPAQSSGRLWVPGQ